VTIGKGLLKIFRSHFSTSAALTGGWGATFISGFQLFDKCALAETKVLPGVYSVAS
jgi:hypothetical protein